MIAIRKTSPALTHSPPSFKSVVLTSDVGYPDQKRHAEKVRVLAATLVKRYGKAASTFVAQQVIESDDANRATWLAVMKALPVDGPDAK